MDDKAIAGTYYSRAWWTSLSPALLLFSMLCFAIGRSGGNAVEYFAKHWLIGPPLLICIVGLLCLAIGEIRQGLRQGSGFIS